MELVDTAMVTVVMAAVVSVLVLAGTLVEVDRQAAERAVHQVAGLALAVLVVGLAWVLGLGAALVLEMVEMATRLGF